MPERKKQTVVAEQEPIHGHTPDALDTVAVRSLDLRDNRVLPRNQKLECLERKPFDYSKMLTLELFEHNVYISPLRDFNVLDEEPVSQHSMPREFSMFTNRRNAIDDIFYSHGKTTTRMIDQQKRDAGIDVDTNMHRLIEQFVTGNARGKKIIHDMGLYGTPLNEMSPKESIYLIGYLMNELTNYDRENIQSNSKSDLSSSVDIVKNGMRARSKEAVQPMGVCRNFADTAEAIFLALKSKNPLLTNIYCQNMGGDRGAINPRYFGMKDANILHAWPDFVAISGRGDMMVTSVDPTFAKRSGRELEQYDQTQQRMSAVLRHLAAGEQHNYTTRKQKNMERITDHYSKRIERAIGMLKKQYSDSRNEDGKLSLNDIPSDSAVFRGAMQISLDYIIVGMEFGGSAFGWAQGGDKSAENMFKFAKQAAIRESIVLSDAEYGAARWSLKRAVDDPKLAPQQKTIGEQLINKLDARHKSNVTTAAHQRMRRLNEGQLNLVTLAGHKTL